MISNQGLRIAIACCLLLCAWARQALGAPLEFSDFARAPTYTDVQIAPDGKHLAAIAEQQGTKILTVFDRKSMQVTAAASAAQEGDIEQFWWANDDRLLYTVSVPAEYQEAAVGNGNLYAMNSDGRRHEIIFGFQAQEDKFVSTTLFKQRKATRADFEIVDMLPDKKHWIKVAVYPVHLVNDFWQRDSEAYPRVIELNVKNGRKRRAEALPLPGAIAITDRGGELRASIGQDDEAYLEVHWKDYDGDWQVFDLQKAGIVGAKPFSFSADSTTLLIKGQPDEGGPQAIYRLNLTDGTHTLVHQNEAGDVVSPVLDMSTREAVALYSQPGHSHYEYLVGNENDTVRYHKSLRQQFDGQNVRITSHTEDGTELIAHISGSTNPGEFYLLYTDSNQLQSLFATHGWLDRSQLRPQQPVIIPVRDGVQLPGYITLPEDNAGAGPLVVMIHGGPHGPRDWWAYDPVLQMLVSRGYAVLQVNYRGSGGFGSYFQAAGHGEWGGKMQDDITDATRWAIEQGYADAGRICIYGASYGGYAALMGAVKEPDMYQCAIGQAGVYDLATMFRTGDIPEQRTGKAYLRRALGTDPGKLQARSPVHQAGSIKADVLLIHGGKDKRVPPVHAEMIREALTAAGNSPAWLMFEREGHGVAALSNRVQMFKRIDDFLDQHIGVQAELPAKVETADSNKIPESE